VLFKLANSQIEADDEVSVWRKSGGTNGVYTLRIDGVAPGSCLVALGNRSSMDLAEAVTIGFAVRKAMPN
jgi:hypothetical protein